MTKREFMELKADEGFDNALNELAGQVEKNEMISTTELEELACDYINAGWYYDAETMCRALQLKNKSIYWIFDHLTEDLRVIVKPVSTLKDVEHLFEEEEY